MKKSLKVIYPLLGLFCIANCSDCNNFATPDCFGGNGDLDYPTFIRDFQQNCSKDFDNFIKYFGKPCVLKQVYPEPKTGNQDVFKAFSETALDLGNKYQAYLFSKNDSELNDDEKTIKNKFKEKGNIQKEYQDLLSNIKTANDTDKKKLQKEAMEMLKKHKDLTDTVKPLLILQKTIEEPVKLNGVEIVEFSADAIISNDALNITWTIRAAQSGGNIKIHRYYLEGFAKKFDADNYFTIDFSTGATQKEKFTQKISLLEDNDIFANVHLATIPECFVKCDTFKINIKVETAGYHMTYRFPYLKLIGNGVYEYTKLPKNTIESDLACCFGLSKDEYLNTNIMFHYVSNKAINTIEGAMPIYNGPYIASACEISNASKESHAIAEKNDTIAYDKTNLPDKKLSNSANSLYDTFDLEFYITGVKSHKIDVSFEGLKLIKDIKNRSYSGLQHKDIKFSDTSNKILRVYAQRILNEIYHVGANACTCTKVAALCQFVHYWMTYQDHERTHAMNPIEIFTYRRGICVDYTHLLLGLCSSIGINSIAKISGIGCNNFSHYEKHSWCVCYCPECCHCFEFDPTWNQCFQVGPEHIFLAKTHRVNDTADKTSNGDLHKGIEVDFFKVNKKIVIQ
jgi:hypothetical protein